ncbi:IS701 family transposase [Streptomyces olivochromogenes]|uniref:DDE transposase n=2 Tax=Streptomyces olivochromogenes TaxID=1963 RepID=A0A250VW93_STROL|nr:IS701 family transposase [Streptomyces olivochromogenes]GAX58349.1 DDE transposase [Streptomyces olivochromogenes]
MDAHEVNRARAQLAIFVADVFASIPRKDQRAKSDCYLRGLMTDGRRKSIQAMASRLPDGNEQNLQQFVNQSTWDPVPVRRRIARRLVPQIGPDAWAVDDVSFPKDGRMSVGVAHQYCGALGKQANCQVAVSVHAVSDTASCPLNWRLFLPQEWSKDTFRRRRTGVPKDVGHREKWRLALDALDELATWQLVPPVVVADAGYGQNADFRAALAERDIPYVVGIRGDITVQSHNAHPAAPAWSGTGRPPVPRYRQPPVTVADLAAAAGREAFTEVTWREGSRGAMTSRFLSVKVRPAGVRSRRLAQQAAVAEHGRWDGVLPQARLLAEWPDGEDKPTRFWLSDLPDDTPIPELVRLAKIRWRIEHDYRELKHGLGLDHFEGRSWNGWHHHATLVTAAHAFLTEQRLAPKADTAGSPSTRSSTPSKTC